MASTASTTIANKIAFYTEGTAAAVNDIKAVGKASREASGMGGTKADDITSGTLNAVNRFRQLAAEQKKVVETTEAVTGKFTGLAKVIGHSFGAGRYEFMGIYAVGQVLEAAGKGMGTLMPMLANTAGFAAGAAGIGLVLMKAHSLSNETDKLTDNLKKFYTDNESGLKNLDSAFGGYLNNWITGWKEILGKGTTGEGLTVLGAPSQAEVIRAYEGVTKTMLAEHALAKAVIGRHLKEDTLIEKQAIALDLEATIRGVRVNALDGIIVKKVTDTVKHEVERRPIEIEIEAHLRGAAVTGEHSLSVIADRAYLAAQKRIQKMKDEQVENLKPVESDIRGFQSNRTTMAEERRGYVKEHGRLVDLAKWINESTDKYGSHKFPAGTTPTEANTLSKMADTIWTRGGQWSDWKKKATEFVESERRELLSGKLNPVNESLYRNDRRYRAAETIRDNRITAGDESLKNTDIWKRLNMGKDEKESAVLFGESVKREITDQLKSNGVYQNEKVVDAFTRLLDERVKNAGEDKASMVGGDFKQWASTTIGSLKKMYETPETAGFSQKRKNLQSEMDDWDSKTNPFLWDNWPDLTADQQKAAMEIYGGLRRQFLEATQKAISSDELRMELMDRLTNPKEGRPETPDLPSKRGGTVDDDITSLRGQIKTRDLRNDSAEKLEEGRLKGKPDWAAELVNELKKTNPNDWFTKLGVKTEREGYIRAEGIGDKMEDANGKWKSAIEQGPRFAGAAQQGSAEEAKILNESKFRSENKTSEKEVQKQQLQTLKEIADTIRTKGVAMYVWQ